MLNDANFDTQNEFYNMPLHGCKDILFQSVDWRYNYSMELRSVFFSMTNMPLVQL